MPVPYVHWIDETVEKLAELKLEKYVLNSGISVSGPIHIGHARTELITPNAIKRGLEKKGFDAVHICILYTQDPLKSKVKRIVGEEFAEKWAGTRLIDVPCPYSCCSNWVEHYLKNFYETVKEFGLEVEFYTTTEIYRDHPRMKEAIITCIEKREELVEILNKFRTKKLPENYIPFMPLCNNCKSIDRTIALSVDIDSYEVEYKCLKCGSTGYSSMREGKLPWRVEWPALWYTFNVTFEPYGKDMAVAGGSMESASIIVRKIFGLKEPHHMFMEWVALLVNNKPVEMTSSGGVYFEFTEWTKVSDPRVLKYWYFYMKPNRHLTFEPSLIPKLNDLYDEAEKVYFNIVEEPDEKERQAKCRSFELANDDKPPKEPLLLPSYRFMSTIVQAIGLKLDKEKILGILKRTRHIDESTSDERVEAIMERAKQAIYWVSKYAPPQFRINIVEKLDESILSKLTETDRNFFREIAEFIESRKGIKPEVLEQVIYDKARKHYKPHRKGFQKLYLIFLGTKSGPRIAPFLMTLDKSFVIKRLKLLE